MEIINTQYLDRDWPLNTGNFPLWGPSAPSDVFSPEFLITFEAWAKLAQQWLVCVLGMGNILIIVIIVIKISCDNHIV